jgi:hypothetical protein
MYTLHEIYNLSPNRLVPIYLMCSYAYYILNESLVSDDVYDACCKRLLNEWGNITHKHRIIIDKESLPSTTGFTYHVEDYPLIVRLAVEYQLKNRN